MHPKKQTDALIYLAKIPKSSKLSKIGIRQAKELTSHIWGWASRI